MKKRIAFIHYTYPPVIGGVEFIMEGHARFFLKAGHPVKIIAAKGESSVKGIEVKRCALLSADDPGIAKLQKSLSVGEIPDGFYQTVEEIKRFLKKELETVDVCFIHNVMNMHFNLMMTAALAELIEEPGTGTVFYNWVHDASIINPHYSFIKPDEFPWKLLKTFLPRAHYIAISALRQRQLSELFSVSEEKIKVVPDGIDVQSFLNITDVIWDIFLKYGLFTRDIVAFFPSRILRRKNYELAIRIIKALNDSGKKSVLLLTGPPDPHNSKTARYLGELKKLIQECNLEENVLFLHDIIQEYNKEAKIRFLEIKNLYSLSDLLLLTSSQEGFGIPLLEAAASRIPVACSRIEPLTEIDIKRTLMFDLDDDLDMIANRISDFLEKESRYKQFKKLVGTYSWEAIYQNYLNKMVE